MANRLDTAEANKSHKPRSPQEGHAQHSGGEARPDKAEGRREKNREVRPSAGNDKAFDDIEKLVSGKRSKSGCLSKVLMMFLLLSVAGTYFYLSL